MRNLLTRECSDCRGFGAKGRFAADRRFAPMAPKKDSEKNASDQKNLGGRPKGSFGYLKTDSERGHRQGTICEIYDPGRDARKHEEAAKRVCSSVIANLFESAAKIAAHEWELRTRWTRAPGCCPMCEKVVASNKKYTSRPCKRVVCVDSDLGLFLRGLCDWSPIAWCSKPCTKKRLAPRDTCDNCYWVCERGRRISGRAICCTPPE